MIAWNVLLISLIPEVLWQQNVCWKFPCCEQSHIKSTRLGIRISVVFVFERKKKKKNLSSFFFLDAKRKYRKESWKEVEISSFLFIDKLYIMMILDDRYTLTLFCILYFESVTMLQKGKSKRTIKNKMHEISHLNLLKRIYPWTL